MMKPGRTRLTATMIDAIVPNMAYEATAQTGATDLQRSGHPSRPLTNAEFGSSDGAEMLVAEHHRRQGGGPAHPSLSSVLPTSPTLEPGQREGRRLLRRCPTRSCRLRGNPEWV
jgi:hypothetical protein